MKASDFENLLIRTKVDLLAAFKNSSNIKDLDVYTKTILDYQELIAKHLFKEIHDLETQITLLKGDLLKDSRVRFEEIMKKLSAE